MTKFMHRLAATTLGSALLFSAASSYAFLIDALTFTTDTRTGLDWLDLTETRGASYDAVVSQMEVGQRFAGWRYASRVDVRTFWEDAGGQGPFTGLAAGDPNWVGQLQRLWGATYPFIYTVGGFSVQGTIAMTSDLSETCSACNLTVYLLDNIDISDSSVGDYAEAQQLNEAYRSQGQTPIGHALIRDSASNPVPEPSTLAILALGLAGLGFSRRNRSTQ